MILKGRISSIFDLSEERLSEKFQRVGVKRSVNISNSR